MAPAGLTWCRAEPFRGSFPDLGPPVVESEGIVHRFRTALEGATNIMAGYHNSLEAGAGPAAPQPAVLSPQMAQMPGQPGCQHENAFSLS